jgi:uncharacterized protein YjbI with pentapeptide repeats
MLKRDPEEETNRPCFLIDPWRIYYFKIPTLMADETQVSLLKTDVRGWNIWRKHNRKINITLSEADLSGAQLSNVDLTNADLSGADLSEADLFKANLSRANFFKADFSRANLAGVNLSRAFLNRVDFTEANLTGADLTAANLQGAVLVKTNLSETILNRCQIYGLSAWDLEGCPKQQSEMNIAPYFESTITLDDLELAQFIYLLLNNNKIRNVIDTITSKVVLILGRFTSERKLVLDCIRENLRLTNLTPIIFDFKKPISKDLTGTVETLARMAHFIIADLTDPSSIPRELATIVPFLRTTPLLPLRQASTPSYSMSDDLVQSYPWVMQTYIYEDTRSLIAELDKVVKLAIDKAKSLRKAGITMKS